MQNYPYIDSNIINKNKKEVKKCQTINQREKK